MSVILITHHDENIYNLASGAPAKQSTAQTYKKNLVRRSSKASHASKSPTQATMTSTASYNPKVKANATMGLAVEIPPDPNEFLKKRTGTFFRTQDGYIKYLKDNHVCTRKQKLFVDREGIETYNQAKKKEEAEREDTNFIRKNIKKVLELKTKEPVHKSVVDQHGTTVLMSSGLEPIYIKLDHLGKTPQYLRSFIKEKEKMRQMHRDSSGVEQPKCQYITRDEREQLLVGLKHNWAELQQIYQGLPILTDTIPKKNRKSKLEAELKQLEKDIVLVERHPYIYIYKDNATFN